MKSLSHVRLLATPWTAAYQTPPSMGFSRQEYWSGLPLPSPSLPPLHLKIVMENKIWEQRTGKREGYSPSLPAAYRPSSVQHLMLWLQPPTREKAFLSPGPGIITHMYSLNLPTLASLGRQLDFPVFRNPSFVQEELISVLTRPLLQPTRRDFTWIFQVNESSTVYYTRFIYFH